MRETAEVVSTTQHHAVIRLVRNSACSNCSARSACFSMAEARTVEFEVEDPIGVSIGDRVEVVIEAGSVFTASALTYLCPILFFIFGSVTGAVVSPGLPGSQNLWILLGGFGALSISLLSLAVLSRCLGSKPRFTPSISGVIRGGRLDG